MITILWHVLLLLDCTAEPTRCDFEMLAAASVNCLYHAIGAWRNRVVFILHLRGGWRRRNVHCSIKKEGTPARAEVPSFWPRNGKA